MARPNGAVLACAAAVGLSPGAWCSQPVQDKLNNVVESLQVQEAPIEDVLRLLAEQNDLNLIIGPDSMGRVSLRFSQVTLRSALDAILRAKGFQYALYEDIMLVTRPDSLERIRGLGLETRMFRLKYADARNVKATVDTARVLSPWGKTTVYYRSVNVEAAKAASIKPGLAFISGERYNLAEQVPQGQVPMQARSDVLIVTDKPERMEAVARLVESLDQPSRQIAIDVQFVETILDDINQVGINWNALLETSGQYKGKTRWVFGEGVPPVGKTSGGEVQLGSLAQTQFQAVLDMMLQNKRSKLLSQPSITTIDHQPATISVGVTYWIEERTGSAATGDLQITYKERQIPIELIVVPHILHERRILLELRPRVEEISGFQEAAGGFKLPLITSRSADARVEVESGQVAVIGGLIKEQTIVTEKRVWVLSSIPLLGNLFRHNEETKQRTDLSIFITPRIIGDEAEPSAQAKPAEAKPAPIAPRKMEGLVPVPEPEAASGAEGAAPAEEGMDMRSYFPLEEGRAWNYKWTARDGRAWESEMRVAGVVGGTARIDESTRGREGEGRAQTGYQWGPQGMVNLYRAVVGGDSVVYEPVRVILPARMTEGKTFESRYRSVAWSTGVRRGEAREFVQRQRLLGKFRVTAPAKTYEDCVAVETVWFDTVEPDKVTRKVVWYAPGVGPVKVEQDIPAGSPGLKGSLSALVR